MRITADLEKFGDKSMCHTKYDDAIAWYTVALALPESRGTDNIPGGSGYD